MKECINILFFKFKFYIKQGRNKNRNRTISNRENLHQILEVSRLLASPSPDLGFCRNFVLFLNASSNFFPHLDQPKGKLWFSHHPSATFSHFHPHLVPKEF